MKNLSARTEHPNTPESDMQERVSHIVEWTDDDGERQSTFAYATDPMDAIDMVRRRLSD